MTHANRLSYNRAPVSLQSMLEQPDIIMNTPDQIRSSA